MDHVQEEETPENVEGELPEGAAEASGDENAATEEVVESEPEVVESEPVGSDATPAQEVEKWKDVAARAQADLENFRKRMAREKSDAIAYANQSLLEQLFPIIDNFEMGLRAARDADGEGS